MWEKKNLFFFRVVGILLRGARDRIPALVIECCCCCCARDKRKKELLLSFFVCVLAKRKERRTYELCLAEKSESIHLPYSCIHRLPDCLPACMDATREVKLINIQLSLALLCTTTHDCSRTRQQDDDVTELALERKAFPPCAPIVFALTIRTATSLNSNWINIIENR